MAIGVSLSRAQEWRFRQRNEGGYSANLAGDCQNPVVRLMRGAADPAKVALGLEEERHIVVDIDVRCRKCETCLKARARHWALRAQSELSEAGRSWFGTLTLSGPQQFRMVALARANLARSGVSYDDLSPDDQWKERMRPLVREFQLYMKRLRKQTDGIRHLAVVERHKSGDPHMHLLLSERGAPLRHKQLKSQWQLGFSDFKLVAEGENQRAARYVTKYLTKSLSHRVIASRHYGDPNIPPNAPRMRERAKRANEVRDRVVTTSAPEQTQRASEASERGSGVSTPPARGAIKEENLAKLSDGKQDRPSRSHHRGGQSSQEDDGAYGPRETVAPETE